MNDQNKYNCFLIYNISNQSYDSSPLGRYNDWTAPLFVAISWLTTATAPKISDRSWYPFPDRVAPPGEGRCPRPLITYLGRAELSAHTPNSQDCTVLEDPSTT